MNETIPPFRQRPRRRTLTILLVVVIPVAVAAVSRAADMVKTWNAGEVLSAADLNASFSALQAQIADLQKRTVPAGTVAAFAGPDVPAGWLLCNGGEVARAEYPELFAAIGTVHGSGNGASTFRLPDYRGLFLRGADLQAGRDPDAATRTAALNGGNVGDSVGTIERAATALPATAFRTSTDGAHTHKLVGGLYKGSGDSIGSFPGGTPFLLQQSVTDSQGAHAHAVASGGDKETRPANASVNYIIKF
jgi:microcystin-dependent protein